MYHRPLFLLPDQGAPKQRWPAVIGGYLSGSAKLWFQKRQKKKKVGGTGTVGDFVNVAICTKYEHLFQWGENSDHCVADTLKTLLWAFCHFVQADAPVRSLSPGISHVAFCAVLWVSHISRVPLLDVRAPFSCNMFTNHVQQRETIEPKSQERCPVSVKKRLQQRIF